MKSAHDLGQAHDLGPAHVVGLTYIMLQYNTIRNKQKICDARASNGHIVARLRVYVSL